MLGAIRTGRNLETSDKKRSDFDDKRFWGVRFRIRMICCIIIGKCRLAPFQLPRKDISRFGDKVKPLGNWRKTEDKEKTTLLMRFAESDKTRCYPGITHSLFIEKSESLI